MSSLFDNLSAEEQRLLDCYENEIQERGVTRSVDDMTFDKLFLLGNIRLATAKGTKIDDDYIANQVDSIIKSPKKYEYEQDYELSSLYGIFRNLYNAQKTANYDKEEDGICIRTPRGTNYTPKGNELANYMRNSTDTINVTSKNDEVWDFRSPQGHQTGENNHRWAINAKADINLIKKLDEFVKKHDMHYKTHFLISWNTRMDPIVIYSPHPRTKEETEELKQIVAPYIRRSRPELTNKMDGEMVADGLFTASEMNFQQCGELCLSMKKFHPHLANLAARKIKDNSSSNPYNPLSLGEAQLFKNITSTIVSERAKAKIRAAKAHIQTASPTPTPAPAPAPTPTPAQQNTSRTNDDQMSAMFEAQLDKGMNIKLSPQSRLSFAPDIEKVDIKRDEKGVIHIRGISPDGKQSVHFEYSNRNAKFEIINGETTRSYQSENGLDDNGVKYAKEFAGIMDKVKAVYQTEMIARAKMQTISKQ